MGKFKDFLTGKQPELESVENLDYNVPAPVVDYEELEWESIVPEPEFEPAEIEPAPVEIVTPVPEREVLPTDVAVFTRDPAGVFPSDAHRRLLCVIYADQHKGSEEIYAALDKDNHVLLGSQLVTATDGALKDLIDAGYVEYSENGYLRTELGHETLLAPSPGVPNE